MISVGLCERPVDGEAEVEAIGSWPSAGLWRPVSAPFPWNWLGFLDNPSLASKEKGRCKVRPGGMLRTSS